MNDNGEVTKLSVINNDLRFSEETLREVDLSDQRYKKASKLRGRWKEWMFLEKNITRILH